MHSVLFKRQKCTVNAASGIGVHFGRFVSLSSLKIMFLTKIPFNGKRKFTIHSSIQFKFGITISKWSRLILNYLFDITQLRIQADIGRHFYKISWIFFYLFVVYQVLTYSIISERFLIPPKKGKWVVEKNRCLINFLPQTIDFLLTWQSLITKSKQSEVTKPSLT